MKTLNLILALQIAGVLHLGLICAGSMMPGVVGMSNIQFINASQLPAFLLRPVKLPKPAPGKKSPEEV